MKNKKIIILVILFLLSVFSIMIFAITDTSEVKIDIVEVNDIKETLKDNWGSLNEDNLLGLDYELDYVVLDTNNDLILKTREGLNENINAAIANRDTIIDIVSDEGVLGKLIIYNNSSNFWQHYKSNILTFSIIVISIIATFGLFYVFYINRTILTPFKKLKVFAKMVAEGNLDIPLTMDKGNHFGAFTESFDLMREELKIARENERKANQSKKELVASLSHDIKTPVASIKAVSEIMQVKTSDDYFIRQLKVIDSKADQIDTLITNMFNATLEELQELKVNVCEESSKIIYDFIKEADYNRRVKIINRAECIVLMDRLRLSQVIDNVISNSYKYANTAIDVSIEFIDKYLEITVKDYGKGVDTNDLPLVFNKFYRGKNSNGKSGTGLGLYISKYLMKKMQGDIECDNAQDGFVVRIKLLIA